jgi:hypothetical protein
MLRNCKWDWRCFGRLPRVVWCLRYPDSRRRWWRYNLSIVLQWCLARRGSLQDTTLGWRHNDHLYLFDWWLQQRITIIRINGFRFDVRFPSTYILGNKNIFYKSASQNLSLLMVLFCYQIVKWKRKEGYGTEGWLRDVKYWLQNNLMISKKKFCPSLGRRVRTVPKTKETKDQTSFYKE